MALYTLPKRYHPDFNQPNKKPVGGVEIDYESPFSRGAVLSVDVDDQYDIVNKKAYQTPNGLTKSGNTANFQTNEYISCSTSTLIETSQGAGQECSIMLVGLSFTTSANLVICEKGVNESFVCQTITSNILFRPGMVVDQPKTAGAYNDGRHHNFIGTYDGLTNSDSISMFVDGKLDARRASTGAAPANTDPFDVGSRSGSFGYGGGLSYVVLWNRRLTDKEALSLTRNPYQIIKPKNPVTYFSSPVTGGITVTATTVNTNYTSNDPVITLTGSISISETLVNSNYTALNPSVTLTGVISITEALTNTNYTSLNPVIDFTGLVSINESLVNTNYDSLNPAITLTSATIQITEQVVGTQYQSKSPSILLTPPPLAIMSTVCFNGVIQDLSYNGDLQELAYNGITQIIEFSGNMKDLEFNGTIQTTCCDGNIKTDC